MSRGIAQQITLDRARGATPDGLGQTLHHKTFKSNFLLYIRFIDNIFIVWKDSPKCPNAFNSFKKSLNNQCKLKWKTIDRTMELDFLEITIKINQRESSFVTHTFQKDSDLHLHIPGNSSHPPGVIKSIVFGCLETYWKQNTDVKHYTKIVRLLHTTLLDRGYLESIIDPIFIEAATKLELKTSTDFTKKKPPPLCDNTIMIIHLQYYLAR